MIIKLAHMPQRGREKFGAVSLLPRPFGERAGESGTREATVVALVPPPRPSPRGGDSQNNARGFLFSFSKTAAVNEGNPS